MWTKLTWVFCSSLGLEVAGNSGPCGDGEERGDHQGDHPVTDCASQPASPERSTPGGGAEGS